MAKLIIKPELKRSKIRLELREDVLEQLRAISQRSRIQVDLVTEQCLVFALRQLSQEP